MTDKYYITNKTNGVMVVSICDTDTGDKIISCCLSPGANELNITGLLSGNYLFHLENENHEVFFEQQISKI